MTKRSKLAVLPVMVALAGLVGPGCSSGVDVSFNLVNPCDADVLFGEGCQFIQVVVSSLDPQDPLHCSQQPGPLPTICSIGDGSCSLSGDELLGVARMVDVLCKVDQQSDPVARATSQAMLFDTGEGGVGSASINLLLGNINGFVSTTDIDPKSSTYSQCSSLAQDGGRFGHASVVLDDGRVFVTGGIRRYGQGTEEILATAEIFDPGTGSHRLITDAGGAPLKMLAGSGRAYHTATRLRDGRVLLAGGIGLVEGKKTTLQSAELFDPFTETFGSASVMRSGRAHHTATTLATGEILIAGGASYSNGAISSYYDSGIIYDPNTNTFKDVSNTMGSARAFHAAALLDPSTAGGKVLIVGGEDLGGPMNSVEIFNPDPGALRFYENVTVTMSKNRSHLCAVRLQNGEVLVAGGTTTQDVANVDAGVEIYSPSEGTFGGFKAQTLNMTSARMDHTCTLLETGNVLVAGGLMAAGQATASGELILIGQGTYSVQELPDTLSAARYRHTANRLRNGWVYITGGLPSQDPLALAVSTSEYFVPERACEAGQ